jgi:hypothetical protein
VRCAHCGEPRFKHYGKGEFCGTDMRFGGRRWNPTPSGVRADDSFARNIRTVELANAVACFLGLNPADEIPFEELTQRLNGVRAPEGSEPTQFQKDAYLLGDFVRCETEHFGARGEDVIEAVRRVMALADASAK